MAFLAHVNPSKVGPKKAKKGKAMAKRKGRKGRKSSAAKTTTNPKKGKSRKSKNPSGKRHKKRNPDTMSMGLGANPSIGKLAMVGGALGLGALGASVLSQNLVPSAYQAGPVGGTATALIGFGARWLAKKSKFTAPYADFLFLGSAAVGVYNSLAPTVLPATKLAMMTNLLGYNGSDRTIKTLGYNGDPRTIKTRQPAGMNGVGPGPARTSMLIRTGRDLAAG